MRERSRLDKRALAGALALFAIVFACYAPSIPGGFLWDDDSNVTDNPTIRSLRGLSYIWTETRANQQYYPLTHTSFWVEYQLWELWPTGFRITNLLLHALVTLLLWRALRALELPGAWVAAAIFAAHPVHVETVAWITERKNLLSAVFYFASMLAWLRFAGLGGRARSPGRAYALALGLFVPALLSKTAVLTLPAALLVLLWWKRGRLQRADVVATLPFFAVGAAFGALTWWLERGHVGAAGEAWQLGIFERLLVAGRALWFYAAKLVAPVGLNFIYPRWSVDAASILQWLFPLAALALPVVLWRMRRRIGRGPLAGVLYFGLTVAPALGLVGFYFQLYAFVQDHFQYLASAGLLALVTALAARGLERASPRAAVPVAAAVLLVLGGLSWARSAHFTSEEALWTYVLERNPRAWMAEINLGLVYESQGRLDEAAARFRRALEQDHPERYKAHFNLARILEQRGRVDGAMREYEAALADNPDDAGSHVNLGNLLTGDGRTAEAIEHYRAAIEAEPYQLEARYNLALRLDEQGASLEAERRLREAIRIFPGYVDALDALGRMLDLQGRDAEAVELYRRVLALDPRRAEIHYNLGLALENAGDLAGAERHYRAAAAIDTMLAGAHNNLAIVLYKTQRYAEAWKELRRFQALGGTPHPGFVAALSAARPAPDLDE